MGTLSHHGMWAFQGCWLEQGSSGGMMSQGGYGRPWDPQTGDCGKQKCTMFKRKTGSWRRQRGVLDKEEEGLRDGRSGHNQFSEVEKYKNVVHI